MYSCNDFNSLSVLSLYEGELLGVVDKLLFDKKLKKLVELELIGDDGVKLILPAKNIYHIGKNAITVRNNQAVNIKTETCELCANPSGSKTYTIQGEFLGIIEEIFFNDKFLIEKIELDNNTSLDPNLLASCGKNTVIFYEKDKKLDLKKFTPIKQSKSLKNKPIETSNILQEQSLVEENKNIVPVDENKQKAKINEFLIGRICTKDIFNFNNELLIKAHSSVTKKNLKEISKFGKLRELMLFSK